MKPIRTPSDMIEALRAERQRQKLTQAQLAKKVGTSQKKIAQLENLTVSPRLDLVLMVASVLGMNIVSLGINVTVDDGKKKNLIWE